MSERIITCAQAIREAIEIKMNEDKSVILYGLSVDDPKGVYGTTIGLKEKFGEERVFDTPLSEDAMTGVAVGLALAGFKPIHVHYRMDFALLAVNQIVNIISKYSYMYGGRVSLPIVIRMIVGRSWGQGAQHSQSLYSFFVHTPGLKVVAPSTPYDFKSALIYSIEDPNPVVFIEHRMLHLIKGEVPENKYKIEPKCRILSQGTDITIVGISHMVIECMRAKKLLEKVGINAEVIDPIWLNPLDIDTIINSVKKTGRLLIVDNAWTKCGMSAEIAALVAENLRDVNINRLGFAHVPCPTSKPLQDIFYPDSSKIASSAYKMIKNKIWIPEKELQDELVIFKGPF
ncbi:MAG: alpha-ketoacid dehydrogenase subunit beta [bacterium]|nr:alpha-ketoacid dehydrogenase subunit beta [bacterium]